MDIILSHKGWNKNDHHFADNIFHFIFHMTWFNNDMHCLLHHLWKSLANHSNLEQKFIIDSMPYIIPFAQYYRADIRFSQSQWETSLQSNTVSHWLGANLESALISWDKDRSRIYCGGLHYLNFTIMVEQHSTQLPLICPSWSNKWNALKPLSTGAQGQAGSWSN